MCRSMDGKGMNEHEKRMGICMHMDGKWMNEHEYDKDYGIEMSRSNIRKNYGSMQDNQCGRDMKNTYGWMKGK